MITFNNIGYMGRFGNQMFQFAATVGIARKLGYDVFFPIERFVNNEDPNSYNGAKLLDCFDIDPSYFRGIQEIPIKYIYNEHEFTYNNQTENIPDFTSLNGYFQTEKYFTHIEDEIRKIFTFRDDIKKIGDEILEIEDGISIHVRRGDYLGSPDHHPTQDQNYYLSSIKEFMKQKNTKFYIFSDDPEWCKMNMIVPNSQIVETGSPYVDLYLMSKCKGHIIANSSFSWWGAWLSKSEKVIAPSKWFGPSMNKDASEVYCDKWIVI
jgi:hypothetical protein